MGPLGRISRSIAWAAGCLPDFGPVAALAPLGTPGLLDWTKLLSSEARANMCTEPAPTGEPAHKLRVSEAKLHATRENGRGPVGVPWARGPVGPGMCLLASPN